MLCNRNPLQSRLTVPLGTAPPRLGTDSLVQDDCTFGQIGLETLHYKIKMVSSATTTQQDFEYNGSFISLSGRELQCYTVYYTPIQLDLIRSIGSNRIKSD